MRILVNLVEAVVPFALLQHDHDNNFALLDLKISSIMLNCIQYNEDQEQEEDSDDEEY